MVERGQSTLAIDFGTTTCLVARRTRAGLATVLPLTPTTPWMLSIAAWDGTSLVVGDDENYPPDQLIRSVKQAITENWQAIQVGQIFLSADDVIGAVFAELRNRIGEALDGDEVRLGCPAMWDGAQRKRLVQLARRAGLPVTDATLIDEPVAAGLSWLADHQLNGDEPISGRMLVFDMGGGTLDVAVLDVASEAKEISVLASHGSPLAGDQLDEAMTADLIEKAESSGIDFGKLRQPAQALTLIARMAREAKVALSAQYLHTIVLPAYVFGRLVEIDYTRQQVEQAFHPLMEQAEQVVEQALIEAQLKERFTDPSEKARPISNDIDYILLVGGMSQIPYVRQRLAARFPGVTIIAPEQADPVEAVVKGLTDNTGYERINLHRPAFDFVLEWNGGAQRRVLYEAYTPIYQDWRGGPARARLSYERRGKGLRLPKYGKGNLVVTSPAGKPVRLAVDGTTVDKLPIRFGLHEIVFKLFADGQLVLTDGWGKQTAMRVDRWPIIQSRDGASLELTKLKRKPLEAPPVWFAGR